MAGYAGQVVAGRYRLIGRIGAGGMGAVWRASDQTLRVDVALKEVSVPAEATPQERAERVTRARREALNAARLRGHPGIVTVHDVVEDDGLPWIVMELIAPAQSSADHLRKAGRSSPLETASIGAAVADALAFAHTRGVVHRDIKPGNILLREDGQAIVTDFGIAAHDDDSRLTGVGVIGTMAYIAPERLSGEPASGRSDVFSLGVTLYQLVEGTPPFNADTAAALLSAILFEPPRPTVMAGPLQPVLDAMLSKNPAHRPDAEGAARMLAAVARGEAVPPVGASGPGWPVGPRPGQAGPPEPPVPPMPTPPYGGPAPVPPYVPPGSGPPARSPKRVPVLVAGTVAAVVLLATVAIAVSRGAGGGSGTNVSAFSVASASASAPATSAGETAGGSVPASTSATEPGGTDGGTERGTSSGGGSGTGTGTGTGTNGGSAGPSQEFDFEPSFSAAGLGISRYSSEYYATITEIRRAGFLLEVGFDATGRADLRDPSTSCVVVSSDSRFFRLLPVRVALTQNTPGRYTGTLAFSLAVAGSYSFRYSCLPDYSTVPLGTASMPSVGVGVYGENYFANVFRVRTEGGRTVILFAAAGAADLRAPNTSCLRSGNSGNGTQHPTVRLEVSQRSPKGATYIGSMLFEGTPPAAFVYSCADYSSVGL